MPSTLGVVAAAYVVPPPPIPTTGLQAWWDAADNSTFSFSSGAAVSQWRDKSGTGRHLTQGTVAFQPLRNSTQNTLTAVTFDGVDDYMQTASFTMPQPWTVCLATNLVSDPTHGFVSAIGTPNLCQIYAGGAGWLDIQTPADRNATGLTNTGPQTMTFIVNHPSGQIYLSGVLKRGAIDSGANGTTTGLYVGATAGLEAGYRLNGVLMEAIIYNRVLTDPERQQVESYLTAKWLPPPPPSPVASGLIGWWDASDASSFTFSSGSQVSQWRDKSGNVNHASWVNSSNPATVVSAAINGLAALDPHPGALDTPIVCSTMWPVTMIAVVKTGSVSSGNLSLIGNSYLGTGDYVNWDVNNGVLRLVRRGSVVLVGQASSAYAASTPTLIGVTWGSDNVWTHYRNGTTVGTGTNAAPIGTGSGRMGIGALITPNSTVYDGLFGELLIYNRVLLTSERQANESYLKAKWGTP